MGAVVDVAGELCRERGLGSPQRRGGGGFAEVFVAAPPGADETSAEAVAIKVGHLPLESSAVYREQFTNERTALHELRDAEHVVRYLDAGERGGHPYLITEYCVTSLAALVAAEGGRVPPYQAIHHGIGLTKGLLAVHAAGFTHGDVTPQNALLRSDGVVVLADFGLARPTAEDAGPTSGFDPAHAAPETVREGSVDPRADVYGLGSTLFTLVTGAAPGRENRRRTLRSALRAGPHGSVTGPAIDRLVDVVAGMLDDDPAARPALVTVVDALTAARRDGEFRAAGPGRGSRPAVRIGIAAAAAVGIAGSVAAVLLSGSAAPIGPAAAASPIPSSSPAAPSEPPAATSPAAPTGPAPVAALGEVPRCSGPACNAPPAPASAPVQERSDTVTDLQPQEGFDFDFGDQGGPESRPGLDISGQSKQYAFDTLAKGSGGRLKRLPPRAAPYGKADCASAPGDWTLNVPGVPVGGSICVITSEGNTAILTITKAWTGPGPAERTVGFTYRIWYGR